LPRTIAREWTIFPEPRRLSKPLPQRILPPDGAGSFGKGSRGVPAERRRLQPVVQEKEIDMKMLKYAAIAMVSVLATTIQAHDSKLESMKPAFQHEIPNIKGKSLISVAVTYPPGGKSPSHQHPPSSTHSCCPEPSAVSWLGSPEQFTAFR
jgi:hypothetical protein